MTEPEQETLFDVDSLVDFDDVDSTTVVQPEDSYQAPDEPDAEVGCED